MIVATTLPVLAWTTVIELSLVVRHPDVCTVEYRKCRGRSDDYGLEDVAARIELQQRPGTAVGDPDVRTVVENADGAVNPVVTVVTVYGAGSGDDRHRAGGHVGGPDVGAVEGDADGLIPKVLAATVTAPGGWWGRSGTGCRAKCCPPQRHCRGRPERPALLRNPGPGAQYVAGARLNLDHAPRKVGRPDVFTVRGAE